MKWLNLIQAIMAIGCQILPIIKAVEGAVGAGNGAAKKELVTNIALAGVEIAAPVLKPEITKVLPGIIDSTVAVLNSVGVFETSK